MKLTLKATSQIVDVNGVPARIWEGETDAGVPITAFITRIAVDETLDDGSFARELLDCPQPSVAWPPRLLL